MRTNWAGNLTYSTNNLSLPQTVEEIQEVVKNAEHIRPLGSRHCFNHIADSKYYQISLKNMNKMVALNKEANTVTVEAGMRYGELCPILHEQGYAIHNLASLPHISIAGACATATHGSGIKNGNLATAVSAIEFVNAAGDVVSLSKTKDGDTFYGAVVGLGGLGVITKVTLDIQPAFAMQQDVYLDLPVKELMANFDEIMGSGYSVSLFTDWQTDKVNQVWIKRRVENGEKIEADAEFYGAKLADRNVHPIISLSAENCTDQMGVSGPWYERLPHFKMNFTPSSGKELQAEYFVPRQHILEAIQAVQKLKEQLGPLLMISEVRTINADELWMSPCYQQSCVAIHFTLEQDWEKLQKFLPVFERELEPFSIRPHWGKMFTMPPKRLQSLYPKLNNFKALLAEYDPEGKFRNDYLANNLYK